MVFLHSIVGGHCISVLKVIHTKMCCIFLSSNGLLCFLYVILKLRYVFFSDDSLYRH